jgi:molecular chaperone GrpE
MKKAKTTASDLSFASDRAGGDAPVAPAGEGEGAVEAVADSPADASPRIAELARELAALNDRHLRLAAEFSNYKRRAESDLSDAWGRAQAELLRRFLDVLDDLQRVSALDPSNEAVSLQSVVDGVDLVERKFARALEDARVETVDPAPGDAFDPASMEAVMRAPAESSDQDDTVHQVFQKGYRFRGHLVRPARVSVRKHE